MPSSDTLESSQSKPTLTTQTNSTEDLTAEELDAIAVAFHYFVYPNIPHEIRYTPNRLSADLNAIGACVEYSRDIGLTENQIDVIVQKMGMLTTKDEPTKFVSHTHWTNAHERHSRQYMYERALRLERKRFDSSKFEPIKSDALGRTIK